MARPRTFQSPLLTLAALVLVVAALHLAKEILVPVALAVFFSFLLTPLANRLERWKFPRVVSVISVVAVTFAVVGALGWVVTSQLVDLGSNLPQWRNDLVKKARSIKPSSSTIEDISQTINEVNKAITEPEQKGAHKQNAEQQASDSQQPADTKQDRDDNHQVANRPPPEQPTEQETLLGSRTLWDWTSGFRQRHSGEHGPPPPVDVRIVGSPVSPLRQMMDWFGPLMSPLATGSIALILVIFILLNREDQRNRLLQLFGASHLHATTEALTDVTLRVSKYLRMQFLINASYGIAVAIGMWLLGVPSAITWGVLSFALRFLPYIGPWLAAAMPLFVSVASTAGWQQPILVVVWFTILELIVNNVAEPLLYGHSTGVSGVGVIVAAIFWTWIWGPVGLVLAMPLTVCTVVMAKYIPSLQFLTILLGDEVPMSPQQRIYQRLLAGDADEARTLALERLKASSLLEVYDQMLIPALELAEGDRHAGLLHEDQETAVGETARDLVDELGEIAEREKPKAESGEHPVSRPRVLCIPVRDDADEICGAMLQHLLEAEGFEVELAGVGSLTGELVELIADQKIDIVVISILPPLPPRYSRLLCTRMRGRYPELPIVVGYWCESCAPELEHRLCAEAGQTVTNLAAAVQRVLAISVRPQIAEKIG